MAERLAGRLHASERLTVDGSSSAQAVRAVFVLEGGEAGERVELESRVELAGTALTEDRARGLALDALDEVLLGWLEGGREQRFSGVFEHRELRGQRVSVRAERTFPSLDAAANALLGAADEE